MGTNLEEIKVNDFKTKVLLGITLAFTLILISRLFYLQIFKYKSISQRAQYSTSKISILAAPRGIIYDRNGKILATNKQSISVIAYPDKLKSMDERVRIYNLLSTMLKSSSPKLRDIILKLPENAPLPIRLVSNISVEEAIQIVEKQHLLPGINIQEEPIRFYPNGPVASHVLGYISQIDENELARRPDRLLGDLVGKSGIEKIYDDILRGIDGKKIVEVDRFGKPTDSDYKHAVINIEPTAGKYIYLTLDLNVQSVAEDALKDLNAGCSVVVVNPNTGEILALASFPNFDPNIFTRPLPVSAWRDLVYKKAFLNRALLGYVPGSIWKPVTLISALDSMVVKPNEYLNVSGAYYLGSTRFGDWTSKAETLSLKECLAWSRDTAFYQIARRLTPEQIKKWGVRLGAGRRTGIELIGEELGIVPDKLWKKKKLGEPWYPGNTLHYGIGQSFLLITPAQVARMYSGIAMDLKVPRLHVVKQVHNFYKVKDKFETYKMDLDLLKIVKDGLELCVEKGTGVASRLDFVKVAGKTGSAEVSGTGKTHGWFVAYAPADKPEIVVVVLAEKGGHGGSVAAPVAKKILEGYFHVNKMPEQLAKI